MTNGVTPRPARVEPQRDTDGSFRRPLQIATLRLGAVFWPVMFVADCLLAVMMGVNPLELAGFKLVLYGLSALITFGMSMLLFRARGLSFQQKAVACILLGCVGAPLFGLIDFATAVICAYPRPVAYDPVNGGYALIFGGSIFFAWSCLFVAMLYSFEVVDRERRLAAAREEALAAQMRALRYQVNPHFLFNTLNSIGGLIEEGAGGRAERMVLSLSTFLRTTLTLDPLQDVPLAQELALQTEYLEIERERFSDRMVLDIDVPDDAMSALVPSLILQPLVENAVKHGVGATAGRVEILLRARRVIDHLHLTIENDMPLHAALTLSTAGTGIGLRNVAERLHARFRGDGYFTSGPIEHGRYRASIILPLRLA
ncbi:MAG: histidine kinase [Alphaproteobacteria bacterium]|nr:histidine kinase [Alphaproteobacteria bacterium]MBU1514604.1 histidine kinase [Alphaproteobacteria bacterium]MBU2096764.1 histidine kinase [Alphaproteobacteria bacterium]MBU2150396.1 histidine kinase [Alphaproteobacteria bacterium]MBU2306603.1 histidine kinase [Alphaproteobacteria bacterium]